MAVGRESKRTAPGVSSYPQVFVETFSYKELIEEDNRLGKILDERPLYYKERLERGIIRKDIIMASIERRASTVWGGKASIALRFWHEKELISYLRFDSLCEAQAFLEIVIGRYDSDLKDEDTLNIRKGWITVKCDPKSTASVDDIINYKPTKEENKRPLDIARRRIAENISQYHWGAHPDVHKKTLTDEEREALGFRPQKIYGDDTERTKKTGKEVAAERMAREVIRKTKAPRKAGLTTLAEICTTLKIDPREARAALRDTKTPKPEHGSWAWPTAKDAPDIESIVKKWRKKK